MQDEKQYEQLILQYTQLKNGSKDISDMIDREDFDSAITMLKAREDVFLNCKCIRKYLELTPVQQKELDKLLEELKESELNNIKKLEKSMVQVQKELSQSQKSQKIKNAYDDGEKFKGSIVNVEE